MIDNREPESLVTPKRACGFALAVVGLLAALACGDDAAGLGDEFERPADAGQDAGQQPTDTGGGVPTDDAAVGLDAVDEPFIPEEEEDLIFDLPAASQSYVYVPNTSLNAVAKIDSVTLQITTIEVGLEPTIVRTPPDGDRAVVLNSGSDDASIIDGADDDRVVTVDVLEGANSLILSPLGDFAIAYYDDDRAQSTDRPGSLNEATLISLAEENGPRAFNLVVGLHIREIEFDEAGQRAFFITDDGVAPVVMASVSRDLFVPPIEVTGDPLEIADEVDREVEVTPGGDFALVRTSTSTSLRLVDLADGRIERLPLGGVPTDLDLLPGGEAALVVLRSLGEVAIVPLPEAFEDPETVERIAVADLGVGLATLIPGTDLAALFSTLNENDRLTLLDLSNGELSVFALRKGITAVIPAPGGESLIVRHTKLPGDPIPGTDEFIGRSTAYTLFDLATQTARLVLTETQPGALTFTADNQMVFMLLSDEQAGIRAVEWANLSTGRDETITLRRRPEAIGLIPATGRVYVAQEHELGRMAFIDPETGEVREVTGYHLNSRTE